MSEILREKEGEWGKYESCDKIELRKSSRAIAIGTMGRQRSLQTEQEHRRGKLSPRQPRTPLKSVSPDGRCLTRSNPHQSKELKSSPQRGLSPPPKSPRGETMSPRLSLAKFSGEIPFDETITFMTAHELLLAEGTSNKATHLDDSLKNLLRTGSEASASNYLESSRRSALPNRTIEEESEFSSKIRFSPATFGQNRSHSFYEDPPESQRPVSPIQVFENFLSSPKGRWLSKLSPSQEILHESPRQTRKKVSPSVSPKDSPKQRGNRRFSSGFTPIFHPSREEGEEEREPEPRRSKTPSNKLRKAGSIGSQIASKELLRSSPKLTKKKSKKSDIDKKIENLVSIYKDGASLSDFIKTIIAIEMISEDETPLFSILFLTYSRYSESSTVVLDIILRSFRLSTEQFLLQMLHDWITQYPFDWNRIMQNRLHDFIHRDESLTENSREQLSSLIQIIPTQKELCSKNLTETISFENKKPQQGGLPWDLHTIAEQFFLLHLDLFSKIPPRQFLTWLDSKSKKTECPEILKLTKHFNELVMWVVSEIVVLVYTSERVEIIDKFLHLGEISLNLGNFFAAKAFYSGITHPAISRMRHTFEKLGRESKALLERLKEVVSLDGDNGATYRQTLQKASPPFIPFFGLHFKDLTYINDGSHDFLNDLINTKKILGLGKNVRLMLRGRSFLITDLEKNLEIREWMMNLSALSDDEVFAWSKKVEPKDIEKVMGELIWQEKTLSQIVAGKTESIQKLELDVRRLTEHSSRLKDQLARFRDQIQQTATERQEIEEKLKNGLLVRDYTIEQLLRRIKALERVSTATVEGPNRIKKLTKDMSKKMKECCQCGSRTSFVAKCRHCNKSFCTFCELSPEKENLCNSHGGGGTHGFPATTESFLAKVFEEMVDSRQSQSKKVVTQRRDVTTSTYSQESKRSSRRKTRTVSFEAEGSGDEIFILGVDGGSTPAREEEKEKEEEMIIVSVEEKGLEEGEELVILDIKENSQPPPPFSFSSPRWQRNRLPRLPLPEFNKDLQKEVLVDEETEESELFIVGVSETLTIKGEATESSDPLISTREVSYETSFLLENDVHEEMSPRETSFSPRGKKSFFRKEKSRQLPKTPRGGLKEKKRKGSAVKGSGSVNDLVEEQIDSPTKNSSTNSFNPSLHESSRCKSIAGVQTSFSFDEKKKLGKQNYKKLFRGEKVKSIGSVLDSEAPQKQHLAAFSFFKSPVMDTFQEIGKSFRFTLLKHFSIYSPESTTFVSELGEAFTNFIFPFLENQISKKKKLISSVTKYIYEITLHLSEDPQSVGLAAFSSQCEKDVVDLLTVDWCLAARNVWKNNRWAEIFYKIGQCRGITISSRDVRALQSLFSSYLENIEEKRTFRGREIILEIVFDLLEYLEIHKIDPCNLFIGTCPSESTLQNLVRRTTPLTDKFSDELTEVFPTNDSPYISPFAINLSFPPPTEEDQEKLHIQRFYMNHGDSPSSPLLTEKGEMSLSPPDFKRYLARWSAFQNHPKRIQKEIKYLFEKTNHSRGITSGEIVAVHCQNIPQPYRGWFTTGPWSDECECDQLIFCRLASSSHTEGIKVYLDAMETISVPIPLKHLLYFRRSGRSLLSKELCPNSTIFGNPLFVFFKKYIELIEEEVLVMLKSKNIPPTLKKKEKSNVLNLRELQKLYEILDCLENVNQDPTVFEERYSVMSDRIKQLNEKWIPSVPPALFSPPRFEFALSEIEKFIEKIPLLIRKELQSYLQAAKTQIDNYEQILESILNGNRKNEFCDRWLQHIEKKGDEYLATLNYKLDALPSNYTDVPPPSLEVVEKNREILLKVMEGDGVEGFDLFVEQTTAEVYQMVNQLMEEIEMVLKKEWVDISRRATSTEERIVALQNDYEYLMKVKRMDQKIEEERKKGTRELKHLEMSDVVPVSGLIVARFHIYECECRTALDLWLPKKETPGDGEMEASLESQDSPASRRSRSRVPQEYIELSLSWSRRSSSSSPRTTIVDFTEETFSSKDPQNDLEMPGSLNSMDVFQYLNVVAPTEPQLEGKEFLDFVKRRTPTSPCPGFKFAQPLREDCEGARGFLSNLQEGPSFFSSSFSPNSVAGILSNSSAVSPQTISPQTISPPSLSPTFSFSTSPTSPTSQTFSTSPTFRTSLASPTFSTPPSMRKSATIAPRKKKGENRFN